MDKLGKELFELVQESQGYSYISDAVEEMTDEEVLRIAVASLYHTKETVKKLEAFLRRYFRENQRKNRVDSQ